MLIITKRPRWRKLLLCASAVLLICSAAFVLHALRSGGGADIQVIAKSTAPKRIKTNEDRIAYLASYGWEVDPDAVAVEELLVPKEFDDTYTQYLSLQSEQGFDLTKYAGKRIKRYAYEITNYPTGESGVQAGLLIYKNKVIGGEVLSSELGGFIHGLDRPG